jgi:hypothetical protein
MLMLEQNSDEIAGIILNWLDAARGDRTAQTHRRGTAAGGQVET